MILPEPYRSCGFNGLMAAAFLACADLPRSSDFLNDHASGLEHIPKINPLDEAGLLTAVEQTHDARNRSRPSS